MAALRARIGKKQGEISKKRAKYRLLAKKVQYAIKAFGEYYIHKDKSRTLKTPRSGIQFATPEEQIFPELTFDKLQHGSAESFGFKRLLEEVKSQQSATARFLESRQTVSMQGDLGGNVHVPIGGAGLSQNTVNQINKEVDRVNKDSKVFFGFNFEVSIIYYEVNDQFARPIAAKHKKNYTAYIARQMSIPWFSQQAANAAFMSYLRSRTAWSTVKNITSYLLTRTLTTEGGNTNEVKQMFRGVV